MDEGVRIEHALERVMAHIAGPATPPKLAAALQDAVFPGGARIRPRLTLAVAHALGDPFPSVSTGAACAIELLHCASLVHDDMACFDDAETRRGKPAVHAEYGEALALLAGDALIVAAFQTLAREAGDGPVGALIALVSEAVGAPHGITAGQAWESEAEIPLEAYHAAKTGALFVGATAAGAVAAGGTPGPWRALGEKLGVAYQVADDLRDAAGTAEELGKPVGQDAAHDRPNAVAVLGLDEAVLRLRDLVGEAADSIPACRNDAALRALILNEAKRLMPASLATPRR